jgi:transcriptional regulator with XRE-family HTH domain
MTAVSEFRHGLMHRRRRLGISQRALSVRIGVAESTVAEWEAGRYTARPPMAEHVDQVLTELERDVVTEITREHEARGLHDVAAPHPAQAPAERIA